MMMPTVEEERAAALARAHKEFAPRLRTPWRSNGPLVSLLFFVLTIIAVAATFGFFALLELPKGWITCAMAIALAEWLIHRMRFFGTGVESALWIGGLCSFIFGLKGEGKPEALLLFAAAAIASALRVRNAWIGTAGVIFIVAYVNEKDLRDLAFVLALAIGLAATVLLASEWKRPSSELFLSILTVVMPVVAAIAGPPLEPEWSLLWLGVTAGLIVAGLRIRHHAPLVAAFVTLVLAAIEAKELFDWTNEWTLMASGALLLVAAAWTTRELRGRTSGVVLDASEIGAIEMIATVQIAPTPNVAPQPEAGGGHFGGAGASGTF